MSSRGRTVTMASEEDTNETSHQLQIPTRSFLSGQTKLQSMLAKGGDKEVFFHIIFGNKKISKRRKQRFNYKEDKDHAKISLQLQILSIPQLTNPLYLLSYNTRYLTFS